MSAQPDSSNVNLCLALGGGAAHAIAHIGVLQVLEEAGIQVDAVTGTSAGALVGLLYAGGLSPTQLAEEAGRLRWRDLARLQVPWRGLATNEPMEQYIASRISARRFDELRLPLAIVTTDLWSGERVILREGEVLPAVRATCAVPGLFQPVEHRGRLLADGGLVENVPVKAAREMGAEVVIAVDVNRRFLFSGPPTNVFQMVMAALHVMVRRFDQEVDREADLLVVPEIGPIGWDELEEGPTLVSAGRRAMEEQLPRLREVLIEHAERIGPLRALVQKMAGLVEGSN